MEKQRITKGLWDNFHVTEKVKWKFSRVELSESESEVAQSCPTLCDPLDYTVHRILQARILEWVAFPFSRWSSWPRNCTQVSHIAGRFLTNRYEGSLELTLVCIKINTLSSRGFTWVGILKEWQRVPRIWLTKCSYSKHDESYGKIVYCCLFWLV